MIEPTPAWVITVSACRTWSFSSSKERKSITRALPSGTRDGPRCTTSSSSGVEGRDRREEPIELEVRGPDGDEDHESGARVDACHLETAQ